MPNRKYATKANVESYADENEERIPEDEARNNRWYGLQLYKIF